MAGNFAEAGIPGKLQFGGGWWFLDQKDGIEAQLNALSNCGLLSRFVGMLTDSRSFMSYPRHEYFRRVLCNLLGGEMESGRIARRQGVRRANDPPYLFRQCRRLFWPASTAHGCGTIGPVGCKHPGALN